MENFVRNVFVHFHFQFTENEFVLVPFDSSKLWTRFVSTLVTFAKVAWMHFYRKFWDKPFCLMSLLVEDYLFLRYCQKKVVDTAI